MTATWSGSIRSGAVQPWRSYSAMKGFANPFHHECCPEAMAFNRRMSLRQPDEAEIVHPAARGIAPIPPRAARSSRSTAEGTAGWLRTTLQMQTRAVTMRTGCSCGEPGRHVGSRPPRSRRRSPPKRGYRPLIQHLAVEIEHRANRTMSSVAPHANSVHHAAVNDTPRVTTSAGIRRYVMMSLRGWLSRRYARRSCVRTTGADEEHVLLSKGAPALQTV